MNAPFIRPRGCPLGIDAAAWRSALLERIDQHAAAMSSLIDALDQIDGDADFEPALGATETKAGGYEGGTYPASIDQTHWAEGSADHSERELEDEHGGDVQDEPHDYSDEGNGDFCPADEMTGAAEMTDNQRDQVQEECERLLQKAYRLLPAPVIVPYARPEQ